MAIYVGVDPAIRRIGICVLNDTTVELLRSFSTPPRMRGPKRLQNLRDQVHAALLPYKKRMRYVAVEGQALDASGDLDQLGQAAGVIMLVLADLGGTELLRVPPNSLKKFVSGNGSASKARMLRATKMWWELDCGDDDDACDAHGLAQFVREAHEHTSTVRHQIEAVRAITHPVKKKRSKPLFPKTI